MPRPDPMAPLLRDPARSVVLVDFDGSLAPIVDEPDRARPLPDAAPVLRRLARRLARVAVVSGRPARFLAQVLPVGDEVVLAGLYGMERVEAGRVVVDDSVAEFAGRAEAAAAEAQRLLPGLLVERKSGLACVLHWRTVPERAAEAQRVGYALAETFGLTAQPARMSLELRPPVPLDKGTTARAQADGMAAALFAGDDRGDLDAFDALRDLVDEGRLGAAVLIAVHSPEAPAALLSGASEIVDGPRELLGLLDRLADALDARLQ